MGESNQMLSSFPPRNKRKNGDDDELCTTDGVKIINGLECKITCSSSKVHCLIFSSTLWSYYDNNFKLVYILQVSYVFDTEDVLHRVKKRKVLSGSIIRERRIQRYQKLLTSQ